MRAGLGLVPRTGSAVVVVVAGPPDAPRVVVRDRLVAATTFETGALYHRAAEGAPLDEAIAVATAATRAAVDAFRAVLASQGFEPVGAVVVGKLAKLPAREKILASHPLIHAAEGELWRALFAEATGARRVTEVATDGAEAWLAAEGRRLGAPWGKEQKQGALAARLALGA